MLSTGKKWTQQIYIYDNYFNNYSIQYQYDDLNLIDI